MDVTETNSFCPPSGTGDADGTLGDGGAVSFVSEEVPESNEPIADHEPEQGALIDSVGDSFDPDIHMTGRDGVPKYTKTGKFRKKRILKSEPEPEPESERDPRFLNAAVATVAAVEMMAVMMGGDDFRMVSDKKKGIDERAMGVEAFATYYEAKGIDDIPPGVALAVWAIAYAAPRFAIPRVRERFGWIRKPFRWISRKLKG